MVSALNSQPPVAEYNFDIFVSISVIILIEIIKKKKNENKH